MTQPQTDYLSQPQTDYLSTAGPYNYEQPLPPVARANAVTQVPPAKKITFYKSGDPQFGGVKMAINQRSFKSFNALMDDLSHRVPLPFGVRTITTPRGIHCINTLDQLEDGGCYLCSDKKYVTPISFGAPSRRAGPPRNSRPTSALRRAAQEAKREDYAAAFAQQSPRIPKKITLVKNGDISTRRPIILNRRNARSFKTLLDEISEIMQFTVKKLYTVDGKRIDSMQALLHCPAVLVCVGREPFKPIVTESSRKLSSEKLPGLASRSNSNNIGENSEMNFGLKAKKSVIHPRSSTSNRSTRFSLSSEKSFPNGLTTSPENGALSSNNYPHSKAGDLVHTLVNDDIEKKVHVNKDGSLSVEMKVRFRLLNDETLQWSTHIKKSSLINQIPCEELGIDEDPGLDPIEKMNLEASSEADDSLYPCDADSYISKLDESEIEESHCPNCGKQRKDYDIWKNPMHTSPKEEPGIRNTWYTHSSCSSTSSQRRIIRKKITSFTDSIRTSSSGEEYSEHIVHESSSYSETVKNRVDSRAAKKCCCQGDCTRPNTSQRGSPEEPEAAACLASSQNEDEDAVESSTGRGEDEGKRSKAGSGKSKASQCPTEAETSVCKETSTVARSISSSSIKKPEVLEDVPGGVSTPNSIGSKSSKCTPRAKDDDPEEASENKQVMSSFSGESCCPKKEATEDEAGTVEEDINETSSIFENMASNQSIKDEVSERGRCSTEKSFHPQACEGKRSDSDEIQMCSVASSSSRISKKSKHSQSHLEADSKVSSKGSTTTKEKKSTSSLHAEDFRSNSRTSYCSRSKNGSQPEATSKTSSPQSSASDSNEKIRDGTAKISSQQPSSRPGSMSESTCSKCGHVALARNNDHQSISSKITLHSGAKTKCTEAERSEDACSQSSAGQSSKLRQKKMNSLWADGEHSSLASVSESASTYSLHCPVPPKGRPGNRKRRTVVLKKSSKSASVCTESELTADNEQKEISVSSRLASSVSKSLETDTANVEENNSDTLKEGKGSCQEKDPEAAAGPSVNGESEIVPSSLPNATPEEVVHEWLRNIPSETLLMKDEMDDDGEGGTEVNADIPSCSNHQDCLEADKKAENPEEFENTPAAEAIEEGAEEQAEDPSEEKASEAMSEKTEADQTEYDHSATFIQKGPQKDLPSTIQTSVQIMKALLVSKEEAKLDRSYSLPEVSPTMGRRLSHSANILITCLASLQLLDEELDPPDESKPLSRMRYTELLNIFQSLWFGCSPEKGGPSTEQPREEQEKVASGIKVHPSKYGIITAMSSSGVDVSSGDGDSREGSVVGTHDHALSAEKTEEAEHTKEEADEEESDEIHHESFQEDEEVGGDEEEQEGPSRPPTVCSKSERGEKAESSRVEEMADDNQGSEYEMGQHEEKENIGEEEEKENNLKHEDENGEFAETDTEGHPSQEGSKEKAEVENSLNPEKADGATEQPNNAETESDSNANEANNERVQESKAARQLVEEPPADMEPSNRVPRQATVTTSPATQERSVDPDPVWVLKLLKKIEKEFMTHYVSAMNDFKVKWNLQNNDELDVMIADLKEEVSKRIQKSIEKELRKIQSRTGKRVPRPPNGELRRESTLQRDGRRRRLQSVHKMSLLNGSQSKQLETRNLSHDLDEMDFLFSTTITDDVNDLLSEDEYCPCDACLRKKMSSKATLNTVVVMSNAPVVKAFDLQQILQTKKDNGAEKKEPEDISEEIPDEKEVSSELAEEVYDESKENPVMDPIEERKPDETSEQEQQQVNEDGTETLTNEEEAEGEEARNGDTEETKSEGGTEAKEEEEDGAKEEAEEEKAVENVKEEEQKEEEEDVKEEGEEEKEEMEVDQQKGEEEDVKEEEEDEEKEEKEGGEDVKEKGEGKEEEEDVKEDEEEKEEEEGGIEKKEKEDVNDNVERKEGEEEMKEEEKGEEDMKEEEAETEEKEEEKDVKEEDEEKEEKHIKDEGEKEGEDEKEEEEENNAMEKDDEEEKEEVEEGKGEEGMKEREAEQEEKEEEEEEKKSVKEDIDEMEVEEIEEEKREEDVKEEEENEENEITEHVREDSEEKEEKEETEVEEVQDEKEEEDAKEEDKTNEEGENKGEEVQDEKEEVEEVQDEKEEEDAKEEDKTNEEGENKGEEEEIEVDEIQDEKEEEDVKEEDETKEEEENTKEELVEAEEKEDVKEDCKDEEEEMKEEEVDVKDEKKEEEEEAKEMEEEEVKEEVALEEDNQAVKCEGDEETNEEENEMDEEQEQEETHMEDEEHKLEDETDGAIEDPKTAEGNNQENASDCAENIADAQTVNVSEGEGAEEDNDAEEENEASSGQEAVEQASPETGFEAYLETVEVEADGDDAGMDEEEAKGEDSHEPVQNEEDELNKAEDEEVSEKLEPPRSASAFSYNSSIGNCSQESQKGSDDGSDGEDCNEENNVNNDDDVDDDAQTDTTTKPAKMYPDSVEEEDEDRPSSQESTMKDREAKASRNKEDGGQRSIKQVNSAEEIDQDDLDF